MRATLRSLRRVLPSEEVGRLSGLVCWHAQRLPHFQQASSVGLYLPVDNEVDPASLRFAATLSEKAVFLPVVDKERKSLLFARYRENDPLAVGAFGIREPVPFARDDRSGVNGWRRTEYSVVSNIDILCLPLVAFDRFGWRLGYGGGYYDRVLAHPEPSSFRDGKKRPLLVGLAYHFQEVAALPYAAHDIPMDFVVTDRGCLALSS